MIKKIIINKIIDRFLFKEKKIFYFNDCYLKVEINKNGLLFLLIMVFDKLCNKLVFVFVIISIKIEIWVFSY